MGQVELVVVDCGGVSWLVDHGWGGWVVVGGTGGHILGRSGMVKQLG